jgi:hypothetical protein
MDSSEVKILLISTGGTIASENTDSGIAPKEGKIEGIVEKVRKDWNEKYAAKFGAFPEVTIDGLMKKDSTDMSIGDQNNIAMRIFQNLPDKGGRYDGIIVTHGTDTLPDIAARLPFMIRGNPGIPIVITGAMKAPDEKGTDAISNISESIALICEYALASKGRGDFFVCMQGSVLDARWIYERGKGEKPPFVGPEGILHGLLGKPSLHLGHVPIMMIEAGVDTSPDMLREAFDRGKAVMLIGTPSYGINKSLEGIVLEFSQRIPIFVTTNMQYLDKQLSMPYEVCKRLAETGAIIMGGTKPFAKANAGATLYEILGQGVEVKREVIDAIRNACYENYRTIGRKPRLSANLRALYEVRQHVPYIRAADLESPQHKPNGASDTEMASLLRVENRSGSEHRMSLGRSEKIKI